MDTSSRTDMTLMQANAEEASRLLKTLGNAQRQIGRAHV